MKFSRKVGSGPVNKKLNFCSDPDHRLQGSRSLYRQTDRPKDHATPSAAYKSWVGFHDILRLGRLWTKEEFVWGDGSHRPVIYCLGYTHKEINVFTGVLFLWSRYEGMTVSRLTNA